MNKHNNLPNHIGIIMDGNGRWAKNRGLPRNVGHKNGAEVFKKTVRYARSLGVKHLTVYVFSTENWKRPTEEIAGIMSLLRSYLKNMHKEIDKNAVVKVLGDTSMLDSDIKEQINFLEDKTKNNDGICLNLALCYGGRAEIVMATKALLNAALLGEIKVDDINEDLINNYLYTQNQPDVDLVIRTGGEKRVSNFLLWQSAYAEYIFLDTLWPDFNEKEFELALQEYSTRTRRMGDVK